MYALFEGDRQIGNAFPTEKEVWQAALLEASLWTFQLPTKRVARFYLRAIMSERSATKFGPA